MRIRHKRDDSRFGKDSAG
jgi:hypothetical protein